MWCACFNKIPIALSLHSSTGAQETSRFTQGKKMKQKNDSKQSSFHQTSRFTVASWMHLIFNARRLSGAAPPPPPPISLVLLLITLLIIMCCCWTKTRQNSLHSHRWGTWITRYTGGHWGNSVFTWNEIQTEQRHRETTSSQSPEKGVYRINLLKSSP